MLTLLAALVGCDLADLASNEPSTLIRDVRTVAMVMEPPEVRPLEEFQVTPTVVNPQGRELDVLAWSCTPTRDGCLELTDGNLPQARLDWLGQSATLRAPALPDKLLLFGEPLPLPVYTLVCEAGTCPVIESVALGLEAPEDLQGPLSDPLALLQDLPEDGVFLSAHSVRVSARQLDRNENPEIDIEPSFEGGCDLPGGALGPNQAVEMCFVTRDSDGGPMVAYAYSTAGRMLPARERVRGRRVRFTFQAPDARVVGDEGGGVLVYVVAEEDDGAGSAVYSTTFTVTPGGG